MELHLKVVVYHSYYGCDTGCCGHSIELIRDDDETERHEFTFGHPYDENFRSWAEAVVREEFGEEHVKNLDWEGCLILDD